MWQQQPNALDNIALSAIVASVPIVMLCAILLSRKMAGWLASLYLL
jgi:L-lactate permease